jgi:hypothetical protein
MKWTPWIAALILIAFAVALAVTIVNRLSDREVALIVGAVCGAGAATPLGVMFGLAFAAQRQRDRELRLPPAPPPIIYVPPSLPPSGPVNTAAPLRRSYSVIGGNEIETEL